MNSFSQYSVYHLGKEDRIEDRFYTHARPLRGHSAAEKIGGSIEEFFFRMHERGMYWLLNLHG
jgi:hypothetical protein